MKTRSINAAAGVIAAAMKQGKQLPASLAIALDAAGLLNSPEHAAEFERMRSLLIDARSADEDPIRYAVIGDVVTAPHAFEREYQGESDAKRRLPNCKVCGRPAIDSAHDEDVRPQVQKLRALLAVQRAAVEDPHDSPLHHQYRIARDLPPAGGATC